MRLSDLVRRLRRGREARRLRAAERLAGRRYDGRHADRNLPPAGRPEGPFHLDGGGG
jgi:hypothetical protein